MFASEFRSADEAALVAEIQACTRAEAVTAARRFAAIGELAARADAPGLDERQQWAVDLWACAAAEVAAAMSISQRKASGQMRIALALRERLPKLAARFSAGEISAKLVSAITWRTHLVIGAELMARIDEAVTERAVAWGALSEERLELAIDAIVETHDPDARRRFHEAARQCDVRLGKPDDDTGTASLWGRLSAVDAELLDKRIAEMIAGVCEGDPRTEGQRRAAALGAMAAGADRLACHCGGAQCPRAGAADPRAAAFVIHAITDTTPTPTKAKANLSRPTNTNAESSAPKPDAQPPMTLIVGGGVIPPALLAELIDNGATVRPVYRPYGVADPGYRPSRACERFVHMRDMTCRFPGCDRPAQNCDIDHTTPYPGGPTHPSNNKCLCRLHHLLKTFCGWRDEQYPDGTVVWTAPSGHTYRTYPFSRVLFPNWDTTTADLPPRANAPPPSAQRALKMPRRRRTRAAENTARINAERKLNKRDAARDLPSL
ncbi:HNH endonuclease signature motif containing protein [Mycolicibacterium holsaticum]|uniref:HNH nuclease domain-containing protein n=1 Tax=Mycolicibacterium holsaticum TaxID=152142 RepID=A0A1E3S193_9MYCO|nr:HNH endonuclease signature motif containing protein [Mycolicibacterium holsaticum]ODQ95868.1 hypothetical protein BHQ17_03505 [Mycolicibacterium holsaticum]